MRSSKPGILGEEARHSNRRCADWKNQPWWLSSRHLYADTKDLAPVRRLLRMSNRTLYRATSGVSFSLWGFGNTGSAIRPFKGLSLSSPRRRARRRIAYRLSASGCRRMSLGPAWPMPSANCYLTPPAAPSIRRSLHSSALSAPRWHRITKQHRPPSPCDARALSTVDANRGPRSSVRANTLCILVAVRRTF